MLQSGRSRDRVPMRWICSNLPNPSGRTMALGSTLTEMSTRNLKKKNLGVKSGRRVGLTTLPPSVNRLCNVGASTSRNPTSLHGL
jgi:hypothetical protein